MILNLSDKSKKIIYLTGKLFLIGFAISLINKQFANYPESITHIIFNSLTNFKSNLKIVFFIFLLTIINWTLEIIKWQKTVHTLNKISFKTALNQSLKSFALATITPFKIGEIGLKAYYYKNNRKNIVLLSTYTNLLQFSVTMIFGYLSCLFLYFTKHIDLIKLIFLSLITIIILFLKYRFNKLVRTKKLYQDSIKIFSLSFVRYIIFSTQYFIILIYLEPDLFNLMTLILIYITYYISSIIPLISLFDVVIKGSVSIFVFNEIGFKADDTLLSTSFIMWSLNFILPSLIGFFLMLHKPKNIMKY
jgi:hypothetical protein